jgi:hypothetical protein
MYEKIDKVLIPWLEKHGLQVFTKYRDKECRAFYVVDDSGETYSVLISLSEINTDKIYIHFGIRKKKKIESKSETFETPLSELENTLEAAYNQIIIWIKEAGHTRTPVL